MFFRKNYKFGKLITFLVFGLFLDGYLINKFGQHGTRTCDLALLGHHVTCLTAPRHFFFSEVHQKRVYDENVLCEVRHKLKNEEI